MSSRWNRARKWLIFWCLFIGVGAVAGAAGMFADTSGAAMGMDAMLPYFQKLPFADVLFKNYLFPGIALLLVNGLTNLTAAALLFRKTKTGVVLGGVFGVTLMLWICIQFYIFPLNFMSSIYFIFGLCQAVTGYACYVFYCQEHMDFDPANYSHIAEKSPVLVVYFSRLGSTRKVAYACAERLHAQLFELKTVEPTAGTGGFWWCGRFGLHRWPMEISELPPQLEHCEQVVVCTPVWVFSVCAPVRDFLAKARGKLKNVSYIAVHFNPVVPKGLYDTMDGLCGAKHQNAVSVTNRFGRLRCKQQTHAATPTP